MASSSHYSGTDTIIPIPIPIPILEEEDIVECRICKEEDQQFQLEAPCACSGSVKYVHRACVQRWCNIKGNTVCEICQQDFKNGYTVIRVHIDDEEIGFGRNTNRREEGHELLQASAIDEYFSRIGSKSGLTFLCASASFVLLALVLLQLGLSVVDAMDGDKSFVLVMIHFLRAVGFLLLCYITMGAIRILRARSQQYWDDEEVVDRREAMIYFSFFISSFTFFLSQSFT